MTTSPTRMLANRPPATPENTKALGWKRSISICVQMVALTLPMPHWASTISTPPNSPRRVSMPAWVCGAEAVMAALIRSISSFIAPMTASMDFSWAWRGQSLPA